MWSSLSGNFSHLINKSDSANIPSQTPQTPLTTGIEAAMEVNDHCELCFHPLLPVLRVDASINNKPSLKPLPSTFTPLIALLDNTVASPHTPDNSTQQHKLSPNSLSASGNQTMAGILSAHPHFSVFRKSTSREGIDDMMKENREDESPIAKFGLGQGGGNRSTRNEQEEDAVETLVTPPASSPNENSRNKREASPAGNSSSNSSSFNFSSLDGADLPSLNFGDHSSSASLVGVSPRNSPRPHSPANVPPAPEASTSGVRLIPDSPPTTRRSPNSSFVSSSRPPSQPTRTPSRSSSSSSLSRSQSIARVGQFSPLSLCPSPLIGAPSLPPPPPPPSTLPFTPPDDEDRPRLRRTSSMGSILKAPRTPGTGRSVRFTESIVDHGESFERDGDDEQDEEVEDEEESRDLEREESPSILPASRSSQRLIVTQQTSYREEEVTESALDFSAMTESRETIMGGGGSFLDKLQAIIPSPDVSLVEQQEEEQVDVVAEQEEEAVSVFHESDRPNSYRASFDSLSNQSRSLLPPPSPVPPQNESSSSTLILEASLESTHSASTLLPSPSDASTSQLPIDNANMLFDESNPFFQHSNYSQSQSQISMLGSSLNGVATTITTLANPMQVLTEEMEEEEEEEGRTMIRVEHTPKAIREEDMNEMPRTPSSAGRGQGSEESPLHGSDLEESSYCSPSDRIASTSTTIQFPTRTSACPSSPSNEEPSLTSPPSPSPPLISPSTSFDLSTPSSLPQSESQSQSFYRRFMASRAKLGGSQTAADEWGRLEKGEKASPKEIVEEIVEEEELVEEEEVERVLTRGGSFYELSEREEEERFEMCEEEEMEEEGEGSMVDYGGLIRTFLSPIVELSEPESTANSPFEELVASLKRSQTLPQSRSSKPPPPQPSFSQVLSQPIPVAPSTPSSRLQKSSLPSTPLSLSKIPRPRNPVTPSQNPFLLQLARIPNAPPAAEAQALLIQELFSTQQDQLATSSSQRFLLSSLVTNLQNEVDSKNAMVENLKRQVKEARMEVEEVERIALEWQENKNQPPPTIDRERERRKVAALEETVQLLADELDARLRENGAGRKRIEGELERTRADLIQRSNELREGEIRLRHYESNRARAEEEVKRLKESEEEAREEARENKRQVEMLRARWKLEAEDRDRTTQRLREEVQELRQGSLGGVEMEDRIQQEVGRRVEEVKQELEREASIVKHELVLREETLADLRTQLRSANEGAHQAQTALESDRQQAELAFSDLSSRLASKEDELARLQESSSELQDEVDELTVKLEDAVIDRERLIRLLEARDVELVQQQDQCATAVDAMRELEEAVTRIEAESNVKDRELAKVKKELEMQKRESENVLEKRDGVLAESEKQVSRLRKERTMLEQEKEKVVALAEKLKRDSADREMRISKLKKRIAELDEDVFGLNIALDSKQQEASHWKRQMSQLKHELAQQNASHQIPTSSSAAPRTSSRSTVRRSATTSVLSGLENHTLSSARQPSTDQSTPFAGSKLSRRSSRQNLVASDSHDLTIPDNDEETPSRPAQDPQGRVIRKSASNGRLIQFPDVPTTERFGNSRTSLGVGRVPRGGVERESKENQPPLKEGDRSRRSSSSRIVSGSRAREVEMVLA